MIASFSTLFAVRAPGIEAGYERARVPAARLLSALAASAFHSATVDLGPDFVPSVVIEDNDWKPVRRHALPSSWATPDQS